jgi:hypothetical protein
MQVACGVRGREPSKPGAVEGGGGWGDPVVGWGMAASPPPAMQQPPFLISPTHAGRAHSRACTHHRPCAPHLVVHGVPPPPSPPSTRRAPLCNASSTGARVGGRVHGRQGGAAAATWNRRDAWGDGGAGGGRARACSAGVHAAPPMPHLQVGAVQGGAFTQCAAGRQAARSRHCASSWPWGWEGPGRRWWSLFGLSWLLLPSGCIGLCGLGRPWTSVVEPVWT